MQSPSRLVMSASGPSRREDGQAAGESDLALLPTEAFVAELLEQLAAARREIAIQLMTFDGDQSGLTVAAALVAAAKRGVRVRLLVDCFARRFVSDQPVWSRRVASEFRQTRAMFDDLDSAGVSIRFTRPNGPGNLFALARNHKKLYLVDDVAYLGGINVSDHNFAWHDFMVRVTDSALCLAIGTEFDASFVGRPHRPGGPLVTNEDLRRTFDDLVAGARDRVVIASPYALDRRLAAALESSTAPDKAVVIAAENNFWCLQLITPYLMARASRAGVGLFHFERFSHAKFVLADDTLLVGSSNFGRHSLTCNEEIGLIIRDRAFVAHFEQVMLSGLRPLPVVAGRRQQWTGLVSSALIDSSLMVYSSLIAPLVPPLASSRLSAVRPWSRFLARSGSRLR